MERKCKMSRLKIKNLKLLPDIASLGSLPEGKLLINTINAHSYNVACRDAAFAEALTCGGVLIPDGMSIVLASRWTGNPHPPRERVAGWDLFTFEMRRLARTSVGRRPKVMFLGSSPAILDLVKKKMAEAYPELEAVVYSPPFKPVFSDDDNRAMIGAVNSCNPDLLWIGMTAPKQEKWAYAHWDQLHVSCHVGTVGAVFDFFAGTVRRAPLSWQRAGLEWLYRLLGEPRRMWRRYIVGNMVFAGHVLREKIFG